MWTIKEIHMQFLMCLAAPQAVQQALKRRCSGALILYSGVCLHRIKTGLDQKYLKKTLNDLKTFQLCPII